MKTQSIKDLLELQFGEKESYSEDELHSIKTIVINRFNFVGEINNIDFNDLLLFPNLESLTIQQCILNSEDISIISKLTKLKSITFLSCEFAGDYQALFNLNSLKDLCFESTKIDLALLDNGIFDNLILSHIDIDKDFNFSVNKLNIAKANVVNWNILNNRIDTLVVSDKQYNDSIELQNYSSHMIIIEDSTGMEKAEVNS